MSSSPLPAAPPRAGLPRSLALAALLPPFSTVVQAQAGIPDPAPLRSLGVVTVIGGQPTSLPTQIPTTMEGVTREQIERTINATDSEDALKYLPSLLVRKRYIGDYNHAILSSRASGTGNSARSAVYADGILLSNYLGNGVGGLSFPPRWGLVTPEEIERVDVMYGPFSAAYPGNSVGAVVDYRDPHADGLRGACQGRLRAASPSSSTTPTRPSAPGRPAPRSATRRGDWSWCCNVNHTDSHGQPLTFADAPAGQRHGGQCRHAGDRRGARRQQREPALVHARHRHRVPHDAGPLQGQAGLRHHADAARELHCSATGRTAPTNAPDSYLRNAAGAAGLQRRRSTSTAGRSRR